MSMLPGYRSTEYQPRMFDAGLRSTASARNVCGEFIELCTAKLTQARRLRTDSRVENCPDLHFEGNTFFECKSVGKNNFTTIYEHRHKKDKEFVAAGNELFYWIWQHNGRMGDVKTADEVRRNLAGNLSAVYVVQLSVLSDLLLGETVCLNSHYYSNHRADSFRGFGWKLKIKDIKAQCGPVGRTANMWVRGVSVRSVPVYSSCYGSRIQF